MVSCFGDTAPVFFYLSVGPHPHGGADDAHGNLAVHVLFPVGVVCRHDFFFGIAQQGKGNIERCCKFCMGCFIVRGNSQDSRIEFLEFAVNVTESLGFLGSPGSIVFGIKVDDDVPASEIL